VYRFAT